jgi:uncharacterized protein YndB with AHSA1/START domain
MPTIEHPERTSVIERVFDAPRALVYDTWTDGEHIDQWWGPTGVTTRTVERNFTVGGSWIYAMSWPGSNGEKQVENKYDDIVPGEKIVWTESIPGDTSNVVTITLLFEDQGEETKLTMLVLHSSAEQKDMNEQGGMLMGYNMVLDGFTEFLKENA